MVFMQHRQRSHDVHVIYQSERNFVPDEPKRDDSVFCPLNFCVGGAKIELSSTPPEVRLPTECRKSYYRSIISVSIPSSMY